MCFDFSCVVINCFAFFNYSFCLFYCFLCFALCFVLLSFVLFRVVILPLHTVVYFLLAYNFTDHYHQVENQLQLIS